MKAKDKKIVVIRVIVVSLLLSGCSITEKAKQAKDSVLSFKESMLAYWACMDGCSNMQEIFRDKYGIEILKEDHDACAAMCWEKYGED